jgi:hypothetical protein
VALIAAALVALIVAPAANAQTPAADIHSSGPLTDIWIGNDLGCQAADAAHAGDDFYPANAAPGDCGTFVAVNPASGVSRALFGPDFANHPGSTSAPFGQVPDYTPFAPVSQTATGSGTASSPYEVTTVVGATDGPVQLRITEIDSYVVGSDAYDTAVTVTNEGQAAFTGRLYHAGDCFVHGNDAGYGALEPGTAACTSIANDAPGSALEEFLPLPGATTAAYVEGYFNNIWNAIANQNGDLPDTCDCATYQDNGAGIDWDISLSGGGEAAWQLQTRIDDQAAPTAVTSTPSVSASTAASLAGSVTADGLPTTAYFQYGLDARYSEPGEAGAVYDQATAAQPVGAGFSPVAMSAGVSDLVPNALYHVRLVAGNSAGTTFGQDMPFTTPRDPPPPPPVLDRSFDVAPVSGLVLIKPPKGTRFAPNGEAVAAAAVTKGQGFVPLTEARQIPVGSEVDARRGTLQLTAAPGVRHGKLQTGTFGGALFSLAQQRSGLSKGLTTLSLLEGAFKGAPSYASCKGHAAAEDPGVAHAAVSAKVLQTLRASDRNGQFRTRGRYSAATVRGTVWTVSDRCNGTFTSVRRGTVLVSDFVRRVTIVLHAGQSYLARAIAARS